MMSPETFRAIVSGQQRQPCAVAARLGLRLAEFPYSLAMRLRNRAYDRQRKETVRVGVPVVSVGNLTLGGTGKTPMVTWLARWFRQQGIRVSIVSRGYAALSDGGNDEARQLEASLPDVPHLQNKDRVAAARTAIEELETQLILLDDGFQHRRLHRDLNLVLIDATEPFGFDHVFPRGMLREPIDGLRRADLVAITRVNLVTDAQRQAIRHRITQAAPQTGWIEISQKITHFQTSSGQSVSVKEAAASPALAFCGIGNPNAFRQTLESLKIPLLGFRSYPDHHAYDDRTIRELIEWTQTFPGVQRLLCTQKDLVKLQVDRLGPLPLFAAMLDLEIVSGQSLLEEKLRAVSDRVMADSDAIISSWPDSSPDGN